MLSIIVSPEALGTQANYLSELESFVHWAQLPSEGQSPTVLLPGDPERATKAERLDHGIPVDRNTWLQIVAAGQSVGVPDAELNAYIASRLRPLLSQAIDALDVVRVSGSGA